MSSEHTDHGSRLEVDAFGERHVLIPAPSERSDPLSDILRRAGLPLNTRCGGRGLCDGCFVELVEGTLENASHNQIVPSAPGGKPSVVRACECHLDGTAATIRIPQRSSMRHEPQIVADYQIRVPFSHDPLVQEICVHHVHGAEELKKVVWQAFPVLPLRIAPDVAAIVFPPGDVYATVENHGDYRIVTRVSAEPTGAGLGVAVDIGTTTVALLLVDLANGAVIGRASKFNEQIHMGEDVVTRINRCMVDRAMVGQMQEAVAQKTILPLLEQSLQQAGRSFAEVRCVALAGNTTMLHLVAGVDPTSLGTAPFTPSFLEHRVMSAAAIFGDSPLGERVPCHLLPGAAAYVGADLTAGIVATGLLYDQGPSLLIDVGTNGEIILKSGDELVGCATAAGPAFEGARLASGMRAVNGAISHVTFNGEPLSVQCEVIGDAKPIGICGSAYVDFLARGHAAGLLNDVGRFNADLTGELRERLISLDHNDMAFRLASGPGNQPIVVNGCDVASLLQAKAAIAAGIVTLLNLFNLRPQDIRNVYLAGGFGTKMDRSSAIGCGLLPGFTVEQVHPVGNTSLAGAYLFLIDGGLVAESRTAAQVRIVELNLDPSFEFNYIDQLCLA